MDVTRREGRDIVTGDPRDYVADLIKSFSTTEMVAAQPDWEKMTRDELWNEIRRRKMMYFEDCKVGDTIMCIDDQEYPRKWSNRACVQCRRITSKPYIYTFKDAGKTIAADALEYLFEKPDAPLFECKCHFFLYDKCLESNTLTWPEPRWKRQDLPWRMNLVFNEDNFLLVKAWLSKCDKVSVATDKIFGDYK